MNKNIKELLGSPDDVDEEAPKGVDGDDEAAVPAVIEEIDVVSGLAKSERELQNVIDKANELIDELSETIPMAEPRHKPRMYEITSNMMQTVISAVRAKTQVQDRMLEVLERSVVEEDGDVDDAKVRAIGTINDILDKIDKSISVEKGKKLVEDVEVINTEERKE